MLLLYERSDIKEYIQNQALCESKSINEFRYNDKLYV